MDSTFKPRPLPDAVFAEGEPPDVPPKVREKLTAGLRKLDDLAREDPDTGEVYVDEIKLRGLLRQGLDRANVDKVVHALRELPDAAIRSKPNPKAKPVAWEGLALRAGLPGVRQGEEERRPPITLTTSPEELRRLIKEHNPDLPDRIFDPDALNEATERLISSIDSWEPAGDRQSAAAAANPFEVLWMCLVSTIGFWVAMAIVGFVVGVVLAIMGALPFLWVLLWGLIVALQGFAYALVLSVVACVMTALVSLIG